MADEFLTYIQFPTSNLTLRATLATRRSPLSTARLLPSSRSPAFNRNSLSFPMTFLERTSSTSRTTAREPSLPRQPRTPNLLTSLVSRLSSSLIQPVSSLSSPMYPVNPAQVPTVPGTASRPFLPLFLPTPVQPPANHNLLAPLQAAIITLPSLPQTGPCQVIPLPLDSSGFPFFSPSLVSSEWHRFP